MKTKKGAGAVIYRENNGKKEYLVLHRILNWQGYEFAKGGIEEGEDSRNAILREIEEETGLKKVKVIEKISKKVLWEKNGMKYDYDYFIVKADECEKVKLPGKIEHDSFEWLPEKEAMEKMTHKENREIFAIALEEMKE